jgi:hypothetical protein
MEGIMSKQILIQAEKLLEKEGIKYKAQSDIYNNLIPLVEIRWNEEEGTIKALYNNEQGTALQIITDPKEILKTLFRADHVMFVIM